MSSVLRVYFRVIKIINQCPTTCVHLLNQSYTWISRLRSEHKICTTDKLNSNDKRVQKIFYVRKERIKFFSNVEFLLEKVYILIYTNPKYQGSPSAQWVSGSSKYGVGSSSTPTGYVAR